MKSDAIQFGSQYEDSRFHFAQFEVGAEHLFDMAGLLQGPICPVVLPSRSDSGLSKYYSIAMACLTISHGGMLGSETPQ